jgi:hypothetical protein
MFEQLPHRQSVTTIFGALETAMFSHTPSPLQGGHGGQGSPGGRVAVVQRCFGRVTHLVALLSGAADTFAAYHRFAKLLTRSTAKIVGNAAAFVERVRRGGAGGGAEAGDEAGAEAGAEVVRLGGALLAEFDGMVRKGVERVMSCSNRLVRMTLCEFPYAECSLPAAWVYFIASYVPLPTSHFPQLESTNWY